MSESPDSKSLASGAQSQEPILGSRAGSLVGFDASGAVLVDFPGNTSGPVAARLAVVVEPKALQAAVAQRQKAVLLFENGDARLPFVMGLIQEPSATPLLDALLESPPQKPRCARQRPMSTASASSSRARTKSSSSAVRPASPCAATARSS